MRDKEQQLKQPRRAAPEANPAMGEATAEDAAAALSGKAARLRAHQLSENEGLGVGAEPKADSKAEAKDEGNVAQNQVKGHDKRQTQHKGGRRKEARMSA